jgi:23S rRNA pseudouridine2605 synthase
MRALAFTGGLGDAWRMSPRKTIPPSWSRSKSPSPTPTTPLPARHGVARVISKLGLGSRTQAGAWVLAGRVRVNGRLVRDPEFPVRQGIDRIEVEGAQAARADRIVVMLNKPRGLLTTREDEQGRDTVYTCLEGSGLPWLAPVGRLDKASEGLLLFCNDPEWAARIASPESGPDKTYHVQVDTIPSPESIDAMVAGVELDGSRLAAKSARLIRHGARHAWLEIVLDEGRNRQIRRLLQALDIGVLRLVRIGIGPLRLEALAKGAWRKLAPEEIDALATSGP